MKNLSSKQIEQVKQLQTCTSVNHFHGNTKKVGSLLLSDIKDIVAKKIKRNILKNASASNKTDVQITKECVNWSIECKGSSYFKTMIEGNTGIYYASAEFGHKDYNKSRLFDKNEKTIKLMHIFNSIVNK